MAIEHAAEDDTDPCGTTCDQHHCHTHASSEVLCGASTARQSAAAAAASRARPPAFSASVPALEHAAADDDTDPCGTTCDQHHALEPHVFWPNLR